MSVAINVDKVVKKFDNGKITVIPELSVNIKNGEFFTLLGPSGCGKTTLLRMIAGFNSIEGGEIKFEDKIINNIPAHKRNIGMVFQNYAIFPHMTVRQNIEYGLKLRKMPKEEIRQKADKILDVVKIKDYQDRLPEKLSGGQQQRVALARAIVIYPSVLLMDEPLSNLDAKLRIEMRSAIRDIQNEVGITTIYVTHDQEEALAVSDRIAVMKSGVIQQVGKPFDIYSRPVNVFVSTFIGHSNLLKATIKITGKDKFVVFEDGYKLLMNNLVEGVQDNQKVIAAVRPEEFTIEEAGIEAKVKTSTFLGKYINYEIIFQEGMAADGHQTHELSQYIGLAHRNYSPGEILHLVPNAGKISIFTEDGEESLIKDVIKYE